MGLENKNILYYRELTRFTLKDNFNEDSLEKLQSMGHFIEVKFEESLTTSKRDDIILVADYLLNRDLDVLINVGGKNIRWDKLVDNYLKGVLNKLIAPKLFNQLLKPICDVITVSVGCNSFYGEYIEVANAWNKEELVSKALSYLFTRTFLSFELLDELADVFKVYNNLQVINYADEFKDINEKVLTDCIKNGQSFEEVVNGLDMQLFELDKQIDENVIALPFRFNEMDYVYLIPLYYNKVIFIVDIRLFVLMYNNDYLKTLSVEEVPCRIFRGGDIATENLNSLIVKSFDGSTKPLQDLVSDTFSFGKEYQYIY